MIARFRRPELLAVAALTAVGFALRLSCMDQSLLGDEVLTYIDVEGDSPGDVLDALGDRPITPPLFYLLAWGARHLGDPTIWIRLPSLVLGTAVIPLVYLLGVRTVGRRAGVVAAALVALAPFTIFYGVENRAYATLTFFSVLSTLALLRALRRGEPLSWLAYGATVAAVIYTHYTGIFVVLGQLGWALWTHRHLARQLVLVHAAVALAYVPWLPTFFTQLDRSTDQAELFAAEYPLSVRRVAEMTAHALPGYPNVSLRELPGRLGVAVVWATIGAALAVAIARAQRRRRAGRLPPARPTSVLIVLLAAATPVGMILYSLRPDTSFLLERNLSASVPAGALAVGWLLTSLRPRFAVPAVALVLAVLVVGATKAVDEDYRRSPYRQVARFLDREAGPGDSIANVTFLYVDQGTRMEIYFKRKHRYFRGQDSEGRTAWAPAARGGSVFLIVPRIGPFGRLSRFSGPGDRYVLREEKVFPGRAPLAVGRYAGERP
jgi:4-amino-4-deoxy-L-arabinose transferase-like glycosyltransferase